MRWCLFLQEFHLDVWHSRGSDNAVADALSRAPCSWTRLVLLISGHAFSFACGPRVVTYACNLRDQLLLILCRPRFPSPSFRLLPVHKGCWGLGTTRLTRAVFCWCYIYLLLNIYIYSFLIGVVFQCHWWSPVLWGVMNSFSLVIFLNRMSVCGAGRVISEMVHLWARVCPRDKYTFPPIHRGDTLIFGCSILGLLRVSLFWHSSLSPSLHASTHLHYRLHTHTHTHRYLYIVLPPHCLPPC